MAVTEESSAIRSAGTLGIFSALEIAVGTHFHTGHGTWNALVFFPADGEASRLLLLRSVYVLSGGTVQPENIFLYPEGVRSGLSMPKKDKINSDHSSFDHSSF